MKLVPMKVGDVTDSQNIVKKVADDFCGAEIFYKGGHTGENHQ